MSNVSNIHAVVPFVSGKSVALTGQRLCKVGYKTTKKEKAKFPSVCASLPRIDMEAVEEAFDRLAPHIQEYLESVQDKVVKSLYEGKNGNLTNVCDEDISVESLIAYLDAESNGGRMTKESIEKWFSEYLEENLTAAIAEKMGVEDDEKIEEKVSPIIRGYKGMLSALSGGATVYAEDKVKALIRALEFSATEDSTGIGERLNKRLETMLQPKKEKEITLVDL